MNNIQYNKQVYWNWFKKN